MKKRPWRWELIWLLTLALTACPLDDCDSAAGPSPTEPPASTTTTTVEAKPPRVDQAFSWDLYVGFSAFAAIGHDDANTEALFRQAFAADHTTARVCAELRTWDRHGLPVVPMDINLVDAFLDKTARIPGAQVLLECICNLKEDGASKNLMRDWVGQIAQLVADKDYKHVALSPGNELWHPASSIRSDEVFMEELIGILRNSGRPVTMDWETWKNSRTGQYCVKYPTRFARIVDIPNLHPWRSPDPDRYEIREMVRQNGGMVLISEPTAYGDRGGGCCTLDRTRLRLYACRAKREGALWTTHSQEGLIAIAPYEFLPNWNSICEGF